MHGDRTQTKRDRIDIGVGKPMGHSGEIRRGGYDFRALVSPAQVWFERAASGWVGTDEAGLPERRTSENRASPAEHSDRLLGGTSVVRFALRPTVDPGVSVLPHRIEPRGTQGRLRY